MSVDSSYLSDDEKRLRYVEEQIALRQAYIARGTEGLDPTIDTEGYLLLYACREELPFLEKERELLCAKLGSGPRAWLPKVLDKVAKHQLRLALDSLEPSAARYPNFLIDFERDLDEYLRKNKA